MISFDDNALEEDPLGGRVHARCDHGWVDLRWNRRFDEVRGPDLQVTTDAKVIEHGKYLVRGPAHCSNCRSVPPVRFEVGATAFIKT
jgi:hypothetical protein